MVFKTSFFEYNANPRARLNVEEKKMRAPRDGNTYQDRRQDDRGNRGSQDNLRGAGHPGGRGENRFKRFVEKSSC